MMTLFFWKALSFSLLLLAAIFALLYISASKPKDDGLYGLHEADRYTRQILSLGNESVSDDLCLGGEGLLPANFTVADFLHDYISFFRDRDGDKRSFFVGCGVRDENLCGLGFAQSNVEGEKGTSRTLWFRVDPEIDRIIPESFVCMGL